MAFMLPAPLLATDSATHSAMPGMSAGGHAAQLLAPTLAVAVALPALAALIGRLRPSTASGAFGIGCQLAMTGTAVVMLASG